MKITYSRDADVLTIQLGEGQPFDSTDMAEGIIVHLSKKGRPLEIEILDASTIIDNKQVEVSLDALFSSA
jgi:uncharacterized protein YuzE